MSRTSILNEKAAQVGEHLTSAQYSFDPASIIAIITAIMQLFAGCKQSPAQVARRAKSPRFLDRVRLRGLLRKEAASADHEALEAALLDAGQDLKPAEVKAMYEEIA
jgi:hypothetical protein